MTIMSVVERPNSPSGSVNQNFQSRYVREFDVYSNDINDGPVTIGNAASIPAIGAYYSFGNEYDAGILVTDKQVSRHDTYRVMAADSSTYYLWTVVVTYGSQSSQDQQQDEDPLTRPVKIRGNGSLYTRQTQEDKDGEPIDNTAKTLFEPSDILAPRFEVTFTRNESASPSSFCLNYLSRTNENPIWGGEADTWLCTSITYDRVIEGSYVYWEVSYSFQYEPDTYVLKLPNVGFWELESGTTRKRILRDGRESDVPIPLSDNGAQLVADDAVATVLEFNVYQQADFQQLGLPGSI